MSPIYGWTPGGKWKRNMLCPLVFGRRLSWMHLFWSAVSVILRSKGWKIVAICECRINAVDALQKKLTPPLTAFLLTQSVLHLFWTTYQVWFVFASLPFGLSPFILFNMLSFLHVRKAGGSSILTRLVDFPGLQQKMWDTISTRRGVPLSGIALIYLFFKWRWKFHKSMFFYYNVMI